MSSYSSLRADATTDNPLVIVVFEDRPAFGWSRWLMRGFRHCFCLVEDESGWILCDPLKSSMRIELLRGLSVDDLGEHFTRTGRHALIGIVAATEDKVPSWLRPLTCVEIVKRTLRLRAPRVWTPAQLFKLLNDNSRSHRFMPLAYPAWIDSPLL